jgi:hypothetical protein
MGDGSGYLDSGCNCNPSLPQYLMIQTFELVTTQALIDYNLKATNDVLLLAMIKACGPAPHGILEKTETLKDIIVMGYRTGPFPISDFTATDVR